MRFSAMSFFPLGLVCLAQVVIGLATRHENLIRQQELDINSNLTDAQIISTLSTSGRCPYYLTTGEAFSDMSLAACELWCPSIYGDLSGDWNCTFDSASTAPGAHVQYYDEDHYEYLIGNCTCSNLTEPVTINSTFFASPKKVVQDLTAWGYQFTNDDYKDPFAPDPSMRYWEFQLPGVATLPRIGIFGVKQDGSAPGTLFIAETWASHDRRQNRAYLSDQTLSFWKLTPLQRSLNDFNTIYFDNIIETSLALLSPEVYRKMGATMPNDLLVRRNTDSTSESEAFDLLLNGCKFCKAAQRSIDQYSEFNHRQIVGFRYSDSCMAFEVLYDGVIL